ncbi:MAG: SpoIIIAC/SpoIIIAD family protein [Halanaerobiales bacterium]
MTNPLDLIYFIVGVGIAGAIANMILSSLNKDNYKNFVNLAGTTITMMRVLAYVWELFRMAETIFMRW